MGNAGRVGSHLLGRLEELSSLFSSVTNARGRGLLAAFDLPDAATRDRVLEELRTAEHVLALACGDCSIRFRPALSVTLEEVERGCEALERVLRAQAA